MMDEKKELHKMPSLVTEYQSVIAKGVTHDLMKVVSKLQRTSGVAELQEVGDQLVKMVRELEDSKRRNIQSSIDMLKQEILEAKGKKEAADEQIRRLMSQLDMMKVEYKPVDKTRIKVLQAQLQTLLSERDKWQTRAVKFEDTCETLRMLNSLQKSMFQKDEIKKEYEGKLLKSQQEIEYLSKQSSHFLQERNHLMQERAQLILQIQKEHEQAERSQRLVVALRRKLNAVSSESQVI